MATFKKGDTVKVVNRQFREFLDTIKVSPIGVVDTVENGYIRLQGFLPLGIPASFLELVPQEVVNDFNTQEEVWKYLLDGGKVRGKNTGCIYSVISGRVHKGSIPTSEDFSSTKLFDKYIEPKYVEPKWYENIPAQGILCRCWGYFPTADGRLDIITAYDALGYYKFRPLNTSNGNWANARPATQEEAATLIYQQEPKYKVGDYFTVVEKKNRTDRSYRGDCFEVKLVEGNLIRAKRLKDNILGLLTFDTDEWVLKPVSNTYAKTFKR